MDILCWAAKNSLRGTVPQLSKERRQSEVFVPQLSKELRRSEVFVPQLSKEQRRSEVFIPQLSMICHWVHTSLRIILRYGCKAKRSFLHFYHFE